MSSTQTHGIIYMAVAMETHSRVSVMIDANVNGTKIRL